MSSDIFMDDSEAPRPEPPYDVGYGKPPVHSRYKPGQSGRTGRKKAAARPETQREMVIRVRDEKVRVDGKTVSLLELAVRQVLHKTIKSGNPSHLRSVFKILQDFGVGIADDPAYDMTPEEIAAELVRSNKLIHEFCVDQGLL